MFKGHMDGGSRKLSKVVSYEDETMEEEDEGSI